MLPKSVLPVFWQVPPALAKRLGAKIGHQRALFADGHLLLALHQPPHPDETERRGRLIWRQPDGTWTSTDVGAGPAAVAKHLEEYAHALQQCDEAEERATGIGDYFAVLDRLAPLQRSTRHLHSVLQQAREACPDDHDLINFRDRAYELERTAELLQEETKTSLELALAKQAEEQARNSQRMAVSAHRLNLLAAFFFPLATLSAIFGINLVHGYEHFATPLPFLAVLAIGLVAGMALMRFITNP